jgi:hypothetical protein
VEEFCATWPHQEAKRWCFDLDNTLVTHPTVAGDYSTCEPIPHMVKVRLEIFRLEIFRLEILPFEMFPEEMFHLELFP